MLAFVNLDCIMAGFGWQLHYMLTKISLKFEGWGIHNVSYLWPKLVEVSVLRHANCKLIVNFHYLDDMGNV